MQIIPKYLFQIVLIYFVLQFESPLLRKVLIHFHRQKSKFSFGPKTIQNPHLPKLNYKALKYELQKCLTYFEENGHLTN